MKTPFVTKATSVIWGCSILTLFLVSSGFAYKTSVSANNPASEVSCNSKPSALPIFPFAKLRMDPSGSTSVVEVHFSSANGACSAMVYSSHEHGYSSAPDKPHNRDETPIALR